MSFTFGIIHDNFVLGKYFLKLFL